MDRDDLENSKEENLDSTEEILESEENGPSPEDIPPETETMAEQPAVNRDTDQKESGEKRRRPFILRFLLSLVMGISFILAGILFAIIIFIGISLVFRSDPVDALPEGFDAYVRVESAGKMLESTIDLEVADIMLASPKLSQIRSILTEIRNQDIIRTPLFRFLTNIRIDAAMFGKDRFLVLGDLGIRSVVTRMFKPAFPLIKFFDARDLEYKKGKDLSYFVYETGDTEIFISLKRNLLTVSNDLALLEESVLKIGNRDFSEELLEALERPAEGDLRILINPQTLLASAGNNESIGRIFSYLEFPEYATLDLTVTNESLMLYAALPVVSTEEALDQLITVRSGAPAIISILPESVQYATILAAGTPAQLNRIAGPLAGPSFVDALKKADRGSKLAFGLDINELLFSWTGSELGVFGMERFPEPVFFIRISDEKKREEVFEQILSSLILSGDSRTLLDGIRISRISFPGFINALMKALKVDLPKPYYAVEDDFLFMSSSAEAVGAAISSIKAKELMVRSENWKKSGGKVPASAAVEIFYSLDRSIPFFLQGQGPAVDALQLYRYGVATLRFDNGIMKISVAAVASEGEGIAPVPGFPLKTEGKLTSPVVSLSRRGKINTLYWVEDNSLLIEYDPANGERNTAQLDDAAWLVPEAGESGQDGTLWAVSKRGMIYGFAPGLNALAGFPIATGIRSTAHPIVENGTLFLSDRDSRGLTTVQRDGTITVIPVQFDAPLLSPPNYREGLWAAYPKSFGASLHLFDAGGAEAPGWPVPVDQIAFGSPFFTPWEDSFLIGFLSQAGDLTFYRPNGEIYRQHKLDGVFYSNPIYAENAQTIYCISEEGRIFKVSLDGDIDLAEPQGLRGRDAVLTAFNIIGNEKEEIFISEAGASVYGFTSDLIPLDGFPVGGGHRPAFGDLNGDKSPELITGGYDNTVRAYFFH
jgi:hypothetical protein